jgi:hypothetical protein
MVDDAGMAVQAGVGDRAADGCIWRFIFYAEFFHAKE